MPPSMITPDDLAELMAGLALVADRPQLARPRGP